MARFGSFIVGGLVGAAAALLCAPRKGEETRAMMVERANALKDDAQDWGSQASAGAQHVYQQATTRGQEVVSGVASKGQEFASEVASKSQDVCEVVGTRVSEVSAGVKPNFAEKNDELRGKIEAARQRIAAQVAKNAEEASAAAADKMDAVGEVVQEAADEAVGQVEAVCVIDIEQVEDDAADDEAGADSESASEAEPAPEDPASSEAEEAAIDAASDQGK